jgi:hypothetical protein
METKINHFARHVEIRIVDKEMTCNWKDFHEFLMKHGIPMNFNMTISLYRKKKLKGEVIFLMNRADFFKAKKLFKEYGSVFGD